MVRNTINSYDYDEKKITLEDLTENGKEKLADIPDEELQQLKQQAIEAEDYDIAKLIKQEQIKRAERERQTGENIKEEGDLQMLEEKAKIEEEKIQSRAKQEEEANAMKSLLDEPDDVLAKKFPWMEMGNGNNATYENDSNEGLKRRPRLNPERKDPYSRETLGRYSDGDVIDLYYREGKLPISEQWLKEEGGYRKVENGKATEEFVTEQEMVIKMRDVRSSYKSETQLISSNTQRNGTETHENINPDRIIKPRPRLNPERKDPYSRETLGRYSDGDVIDLYYREGKLPISEQWLKEKGGYKKVENGKVTEEKITEEEMVIKMRGVRSISKIEERKDPIKKSTENSVKTINRPVNTERKEMSEVQRDSDVVAIGDLGGNYQALKGNMEFAGLAKEVNGYLERTGGNKKVIFEGDILADRHTDGLKIISEINQLREQAKKQGGNIDIIVGNHDHLMVFYLLGRKGKTYGGEIVDFGLHNAKTYGYMGLTELLNYTHSGSIEKDFEYLEGKNNDILKTMRQSPEGQIILEEICNMKIVSQVDDILYCHTNPTTEMLQYLTNGNVQDNINLINKKYQGYLRNKLLGENSTSISTEEFYKICDLFVSTSNRNTSENVEYYNKLKNSGINMITHGHNRGSGRSKEIQGIKVIDIDYSYGENTLDDAEHSVLITKKENGTIELGEYGGERKNKYIGKHIDFHLGDKQLYSGTIKDVRGVGKNLALTIEYADPTYGKVTLKDQNLSQLKIFGDYKISA